MAVNVIDVKTIFGSWPKRAIDVSPDDLLASMRRHGISRAVSLASAAILYDDQPGNDETWKACASRPELVPAATLHPYNYLADEGRVPALKEQGFRFFRFFNKLLGYSLDLYCVTQILRQLGQVGMPCMMDATSPEDIWRMGRLSQANDVDIICTELGYIVEAEVIAVARDYPRLYFDAGHMTSPDGIELFVRHVGAHRLVYGSDYPFDDTLPSLLMLQHAAISEADRQRIASANIEELLGL